MFNLWEIFGMTIFQFLFSANQALSRDLRSFGSENDCSKTRPGRGVFGRCKARRLYRGSD